MEYVPIKLNISNMYPQIVGIGPMPSLQVRSGLLNRFVISRDLRRF